MKVFVIGGGGREHALCWALSRSAAAVFCAPGNPGTATTATNLSLDIADFAAVAGVVQDRSIDLVVVGPEAPLAAGIADHLGAGGIAVFGPSRAAAQLEASKAFAKQVMLDAEIPTAQSETFTDLTAALDYLANHPEPLVVKADGLAAGKGAIVCESRKEAKRAVTEMFGGKFGSAGDTVVIEHFLEGEELSIFALTDGEHYMLLPAAQDHKRIGEGDTGPNTGGMGAYTPVAIATDEVLERICSRVIEPVIEAMANRGNPYTGVLYAGLMISEHGEPSVIEFNCRLGDPEAQAVLPTVPPTFAEHLWSIGTATEWVPGSMWVSADRAAVTTVIAASGYPESPLQGAEIRIPTADDLPADTILFHAGTKSQNGHLVVAGGRVLAATGLGATVAEAHRRSLDLVDAVDFEGKVFRTDIAWREEARARTS